MTNIKEAFEKFEKRNKSELIFCSNKIVLDYKQLKSQILQREQELLKEQVKAIFDDLINDTDNKGVVEWLKHKKKGWLEL